jgi:hypothetical protein
MSIVEMSLASRIGHLSPDLLRFIYEFDDTYKQWFKQQVLQDIWQTSWCRWHNKLTCSYKYLVMEWLFKTWGIDDMYKTQSFWFSKHYHVSDVVVITRFVRILNQTSQEYSEIVDQDGRAKPGSIGLLCPGQAMLAEDTEDDPILLETDDSSEIVGDEEDYKCFVSVYMKHKNLTVRVFEGEILTGNQYTADCQNDTETEARMIDVHWDRMNGLVLYQQLYRNNSNSIL